MNPSEGVFMSIVAALGPESKSFEVRARPAVTNRHNCTFGRYPMIYPSQEVRIEDYIRAYQATGRPPPPCPQEPSDESQRKLLNLPPLFKPQSPSSTGTPDPPMDSAGAKVRILNPSELPRGQEFRVHSNTGEKYQCISAMPEYANFCQEVRVFSFCLYGLGNTS